MNIFFQTSLDTLSKCAIGNCGKKLMKLTLKENIKEFLYLCTFKVIFCSNNQDFNYQGHFCFYFFPWFQLSIVNCHPGWLSNLCFMWTWQFRPTFKNLIYHHLEISRRPPLVISRSWKFSGGLVAPTPWKFPGPENIQGLEISRGCQWFRPWKFPGFGSKSLALASQDTFNTDHKIAILSILWSYWRCLGWAKGGPTLNLGIA